MAGKVDTALCGEDGECPICFIRIPLELLVQHANSCLDASGESHLGTRATVVCPSASESSAEEIIEEVPEMSKKRLRGDLGVWATAVTPKRPMSNAKMSMKRKSPSVEAKKKSFSLKHYITTSNEHGSPSNTSQINDEGVGTSNKQGSNYSQINGIGVGTSNEQRSSNSKINGIGVGTSSGHGSLSKTKTNSDNIPLADQMRPKCLGEFIGQEKILSKTSMLHALIANNAIPSMILWGPPGCGKTSLANIISVQCKETTGNRFVKLSATSAGVNDVKEAVKIAKNELALLKRKTILFIDEIHRFNKLQQDTFLPYVEDGTITLIGATTENPSFSLNSALLSRCRVFVLEKLSADNIKDILQMTIKQVDIVTVDKISDNFTGRSCIETDALSLLAHMSDGDARTALNCLHLAIQTQRSKQGIRTPDCNATIRIQISAEQIKESLQRTHLLYDKKGDEHYNCISALHKSMRGNDADAALFWLGRMLEGGEDPLYVARRLIRFSSEDVGLADPGALNQTVAAYQACHCIGMPECEVILAQCVVYLAEAPKSVRVYEAYNKVKSCIQNYVGPIPGVPLHLRNAPTKLMKDLGYSQGYKYNPSFNEPVDQDYLPDELKHIKFLNPG